MNAGTTSQREEIEAKEYRIVRRVVESVLVGIPLAFEAMRRTVSFFSRLKREGEGEERGQNQQTTSNTQSAE